MFLVILALISSVATAADADFDGCEDSFYNANNACVSPSATLASDVTVGADATVQDFADVGPDTDLGDSTVIAARATLVGRDELGTSRPVGDGTVIGRRVVIDADHDIGVENTFGRACTVGRRVQTGTQVSLGYGTVVGDDVSIGARAILGSLVGVGDNTTIQEDTILARGVTIADSTGTASIGGIIGPDVTIGADSTIDATARIRKSVTIGSGAQIGPDARIGRDVVLGDNVTVSSNARIEAGAQVANNATVPPNTVIGRQEAFFDSSSGINISPNVDFRAPTGSGDALDEWIDGDHMLASDGLGAVTASMGAQQSLHDFGFSVPGSNRITGIVVKLDAASSTAGGTLQVALSSDGGATWTANKSTASLIPTDAVYVLGSVSDLWGAAWEPADAANGLFVVRVTAQPDGNTVRLDGIEVRVRHEAFGGGQGGGGAI